MRKAFFFLFVAAIASMVLAGCSSSPATSNPVSPVGNAVPVSLSITDDPPQGVEVLFFQVNLTAASLTSSSGSTVSLVSGNPIQIDVTQLQALSAFLSTASVPADTYQSVSLTFANPQLVILNSGDASIASSCAVGSVCELTPNFDNSATVGISSTPFPKTVTANTPQGFLIDFHLNTIIQSDLSVNLGAANGVSVSELPPLTSEQPPLFGFLPGTVETVNISSNTFTLQAPWGKTLTVDLSSGTAYDDFPASACASAGVACLATGQSVQVQVSDVEADGDLMAGQITYVQAANAQTVEGVVMGYSATGVQLLMHQNPSAMNGLPMGGLANVAFAGNTTFSIDTDGFTMPEGAVFAGLSNLTYGQTLQVNVMPGTLQNGSGQGSSGVWGPPQTVSFTANTVQLEPSQLTGTISALNDPDFALQMVFGPICINRACPMGLPQVPEMGLPQVPENVDTTSQTAYVGFVPDSFSGLATYESVSVNGWIIEQDNGMTDSAFSPPFTVAQTVTLHAGQTF